MNFLNRTKELKMVPASSLIPHDKNWRRHPDYQREVLRELMEEVGFAGAILTRETPLGYQIIDGHLRGDLGEDQEVPILVTDLTSEEADKLLAVYDPISTLADADDEAYLALLDSLNWQSETLQGFVDSVLVEDESVDESFNQLPSDPPEDPGPQLDKAEELLQKWGTGRGQIWEIPSSTTPGKFHRLMCGDSTNADDLEKLIGNKRSGLLITDPPYAVDYVAKARDMNEHGYGHSRATLSLDISGDSIEAGQEEGLWRDAFALAFTALTENAAWYVWHAPGRAMLSLHKVLADLGLLYHQTIIWVKNNFVIGRSDYQWKHEPCYYGWRKGHRPPFYGERSQTTVWDVSRDTNHADHPTQKPVSVFTPQMQNHLQPGEIAYDPFLGSGTAMVAAEQTGRICFGMEIEPKYVGSTLERMSLMGLMPHLLS